MTADIVALPKGTAPLPQRVVEVVEAKPHDGVTRPPDVRALAVERCADQIARALGRLTTEQRIGLERALDELVDEVEWHKREPW